MDAGTPTGQKRGVSLDKAILKEVDASSKHDVHSFWSRPRPQPFCACDSDLFMRAHFCPGGYVCVRASGVSLSHLPPTPLSLVPNTKVRGCSARIPIQTRQHLWVEQYNCGLTRWPDDHSHEAIVVCCEDPASEAPAPAPAPAPPTTAAQDPPAHEGSTAVADGGEDVVGAAPDPAVAAAEGTVQAVDEDADAPTTAAGEGEGEMMPATSQDESIGSKKAVGDAEPVVEGAAQTMTDEAGSQDTTQGRSTHTGPDTTETKMDALFEEGRVKGAAADKVFARTCGGVGDEAPPPPRARHSLRGRLSLDLDGHRPLCPHACSISAADGALSRGSRRPRRNSATAKRRAASRARRARRQLRGKGLRGRRRRLSPRNCSGAFDPYGTPRECHRAACHRGRA